MEKVKDFMLNTLFVWSFIIGAAAMIAWFGVPLWVILYLIYMVGI